jgi:hypothetical protein
MAIFCSPSSFFNGAELGIRGFFHPFHHAGSDDGRETALLA